MSQFFHIRWPKYWSFIFNISPLNEYSGLVSFRMDWLDVLALQGTLKSLLQQFKSISSEPQSKSTNSLALGFLYGPILTSIHDYCFQDLIFCQTWILISHLPWGSSGWEILELKKKNLVTDKTEYAWRDRHRMPAVNTPNQRGKWGSKTVIVKPSHEGPQCLGLI